MGNWASPPSKVSLINKHFFPLNKSTKAINMNFSLKHRFCNLMQKHHYEPGTSKDREVFRNRLPLGGGRGCQTFVLVELFKF